MSSSPPLNPAQRQAVHHIDTPLLVLAGAGSGKTRVITHKIAWLIRQCGLSPSHIAALTFTNKAAREMKARVSSLLDKGEGRGLRISTFHTLGLDIIRRERQTLGYREGFSIFDAQDGESLIKELLHRDGEQGDMAKEMLWQISSWKNRTLTPEAVAASGEHPPVARLYSKYNQHLKAYNAVDFDDLIMLPLQLFRHHREALERWQNRIRYLLVDEYQDTNEAQYELVRLLTGVRCALTVVGDDDQSIYTWRGARPENLAQLQQDYPSLEVIKLEQNYRSMGRILKVANQLIDNNPHLFPKRLWSERGYGDPILVVTAADEEDEALKVVSRIIHLQFQQGCKPGECAILYRGNYQSRPFEKALREHRIPYQISGGTSFFAHSEVKDIISYLRLLNNPDDDAAFLRVVNTPRREIGAATLEKLGHYATSRGISLFAAAFELGLKQTLSERAYERLNQFVHWLVDIADRARRGDPVAAVRDLIKETDYLSWLNDSVDAAKTVERKTANIEELIAWIARMAA
ncbi:MAG: UvrD-helicase domain-containing protein, partial [Gammaproteobacteria bacterium]|nr:UvrD-helicase domain-containing protein [Gammaproteobacteria bacterium]